MRRSRLRWHTGLAILVVAALFGTVACTSTGGTGQSGQALGPAPAFGLDSLTGQRITSESLKGRPTLLTFGASW